MNFNGFSVYIRCLQIVALSYASITKHIHSWFFFSRANRCLLLFFSVLFFYKSNVQKKERKKTRKLRVFLEYRNGFKGHYSRLSRETTLSLFHIFIVIRENCAGNVKRACWFVLICERNNRAIFKMCL